MIATVTHAWDARALFNSASDLPHSGEQDLGCTRLTFAADSEKLRLIEYKFLSPLANITYLEIQVDCFLRIGVPGISDVLNISQCMPCGTGGSRVITSLRVIAFSGNRRTHRARLARHGWHVRGIGHACRPSVLRCDRVRCASTSTSNFFTVPQRWHCSPAARMWLTHPLVTCRNSHQRIDSPRTCR